MAAQPLPAATTISTLVGRLLKANETVQAKLKHAESKLDDLNHKIEYHAAEARTDVLTGLANRRAFQEEVTRRIVEYREMHKPFAMLILDIDRFKRINDVYGHPVGDEVLRVVGATLMANARSQDFVARYGGEEFTVLMPETSLDEARLQAELIRKAVENARFRVENESLVVTVSAGVAEVTPPGDVASLIQRTDEALYAAKQAGRNCVFLHDGTRLRASRTDQPQVQPAKAPMPKAAETPPAQPATATRVTTVAKAAKAQDDPNSETHSVRPDSIDLDLLGNLNNKTMFCQHVHRRIAEFNRGGATFSTILMGVDNYNQLIAEHGLATAELALGVVAQAIRDAVRGMDLVAKYDDRTFGLILPEAQLKNAICIGERLRKEVHRTGVMIDEQPIHFTISLGVVEVADGDEMATHLERAAAQLRLASSRGGNRTGFATSA